MIYFHKILPLIVSPLILIIFILLLSILLRKSKLIFLGIFLICLCSLKITSHLIWVSLERSNPPKQLKEIENYDAVVVLSGMLTTNAIHGVNFVEWGDPDRFFAGLRILKSNKAEKIIFTRGLLPWSNSPPEGEILKRKAIELGIPENKIILTKVAANTSEEAEAVKELLTVNNINKVIIVTSSFHIPRTEFIFLKQGISADSFPVDFKSLGYEINWTFFFPSAHGFYETSKGIREYIGRLYYYLKQ